MKRLSPTEAAQEQQLQKEDNVVLKHEDHDDVYKDYNDFVCQLNKLWETTTTATSSSTDNYDEDGDDDDDEEDDNHFEVQEQYESDGLMKTSGRSYFFIVRFAVWGFLFCVVLFATVKFVDLIKGEAATANGGGAAAVTASENTEGSTSSAASPHTNAAAAALNSGSAVRCFDDPMELRQAIDRYLLAQYNQSYVALFENSVGLRYGKNISNFCFTNQMTDMSSLFDADRNPLVKYFTFPDDLSQWDVSNVQRMGGMFSNAKAFNQPIGSWNTGKVQIMSYLFRGASSFNQDLSAWDTSNVEDMSAMFKEATAFNTTINTWNMSNVRTTHSMFYLTEAFNQPLGLWDLSNVIDMTLMFAHAQAFNHPSINEWNVSAVQHMTQMFTEAPRFNQPLDKWQPKSAEILTRMFANAQSFDQDLCSWGSPYLSNHQQAQDANAADTTTEMKIQDMFKGTSCPAAEQATRLHTIPVGPLCHVCT